MARRTPHSAGGSHHAARIQPGNGRVQDALPSSSSRAAHLVLNALAPVNGRLGGGKVWREGG
jgi:hypothetical protein